MPQRSQIFKSSSFYRSAQTKPRFARRRCRDQSHAKDCPLVKKTTNVLGEVLVDFEYSFPRTYDDDTTSVRQIEFDCEFLSGRARFELSAQVKCRARTVGTVEMAFCNDWIEARRGAGLLAARNPWNTVE